MNRRNALCALFALMIAPAMMQAADTTPPAIEEITALDDTTLAVAFTEPVDSTVAVDISHYTAAALVQGGILREIPVQSAHREAADSIVTLELALPLAFASGSYGVRVVGVEDASGNAIAAPGDSLEFTAPYATGSASWGHEDGYTVQGRVLQVDASTGATTPLAGYAVPLYNTGPDGEDASMSGSTDDVWLTLLSDDQGYYRFENLPSQPGVNLDAGGWYDMSVWDGDVWEPYGWGFQVSDSSAGAQRERRIYPIVEGTRLAGTIADSYGNVIPYEGYSADDVVQITRGDVSVWTHPPSYTDPSNPMYYDPVTGQYHAEGNLGGGDYDVAIFLPNTDSGSFQVTVPPGATGTLNATLVPRPLPALHPITLVRPPEDTVTSPEDPLTLQWEAVEDTAIVSYVVGIWHSSDVGTVGDSTWTRIAPSVIHAALPASETIITLQNLGRFQVGVATAGVNVMSAGPLNPGEPFYWGVYASRIGADTLDPFILEENFTGRPAGGLRRFVHAQLAAPVISPAGGTFSGPVEVTLGHEGPGAELRYTLDGSDVHESATLYEGPFRITESATVTVRAFRAGWATSDPVQEDYVIETSGVADVRTGLPAAFDLSPAWPNPFNPTTTLELALPEASEVRVVLYDVLGREAARVMERAMQAGWHRVTVSGAHLPSGVYFVRAEAGSFRTVRKVLLLK